MIIRLSQPNIEENLIMKIKSQNQLFLVFEDTIETIEAEPILTPFSDIKTMMPFLFDTQVEDISFAERRFEEGKGYLFTNGTGTGKTFVGLGIANRFHRQNKREILIVVPTQKKCTDWVEEAVKFNLNIYQLNGIHDQGFETTVTTYANFYQNEAILNRDFDLVIYDESHYLNQNEQGNCTSYYLQHQEVVKVPSVVKPRVKKYPFLYSRDKYDREVFDENRYREIVTEMVEKTKVVFLSATPFAYHKSIKYADGCLFDIYETIEEPEYNDSYNTPTGWSKFMVENFGYRMRYNRCTIPESGVDVNLMERNFFENWKEKGVMSTRQINLEFDYSREFITLDSVIGQKIEEGFDLFYDDAFCDKYPILSDRIHKKHNHLYITQLLECIKAREICKRIKQHLDLGRKVVVFHNYNNSLPSHPFQFDIAEFLEKDEYSNYDLENEIHNFKEQYSYFWNLELNYLINVRETLRLFFPHAKEFNGTVNKRLRSQNINDFNRDGSDTNLIVVQIKAGQEGISLHDRTGEHQRVLINLGLPTAPTQAIQTEGRIYREGLMSNAIYEYATLQTTTERYAFATKIAERSKTAENLAMGNLARDLETAFKEGYNNPHTDAPNIHQGTGGKEADKYLFTISEFDKAKTYYFARGKKTSSNKSREGVDYFATPEPLGMKVVEWLNPQPNEDMLEPSAGHGAIGRFFPGTTTNHFVEPSHDLASQLAVNVSGSVHNTSFENYYIGNKFHKIAMNPPFGASGKTAMEHVEKACKMLHWHGGELLAIIPNGPSMEKRLDQFLNDPKNKRYQLTGEIMLPSCVFERAGTKVWCRIVRIQDGYHMGNYKEFHRIDLSHIEDINEFFNEIEDLQF